MFSYITITNTFNTELTILNICLGLIRYSRLLFTGSVPHINCLPVTPFTTYQGNSYTMLGESAAALYFSLPAQLRLRVEHQMQQLRRRWNLIAPSKNISELDCFITHGRTLTCQLTQLYFYSPFKGRIKYKFNNKEKFLPSYY